MSEDYNKLLSKYGEFLSYAKSLNPNDAEDAVQQVFSDAWENRESLPKDNLDNYIKSKINQIFYNDALVNSHQVSTNLAKIAEESEEINEEKQNLISKIKKII